MQLARTVFYQKGVQTFPVIKAVTIDANEVAVVFSVEGVPHFDVFTFADAGDVTILETVPGENNFNQIVFTPGASAVAQPTATASLVDQTIPVITLVGDNPLAWTLEDPWVDPGATAEDDVDGTITDDIVVDDSELDVDTAGTYEVHYDVSDAAGNAATRVTRSVVVS